VLEQAVAQPSKKTLAPPTRRPIELASAQMKRLDEALGFSGRRYPDWMMATIDR
jgi:hypothetical protein